MEDLKRFLYRFEKEQGVHFKPEIRLFTNDQKLRQVNLICEKQLIVTWIQKECRINDYYLEREYGDGDEYEATETHDLLVDITTRFFA